MRAIVVAFPYVPQDMNENGLHGRGRLGVPVVHSGRGPKGILAGTAGNRGEP